MLISINGRIMKEEDSSISPTSGALLYGYGAFETIKFRGRGIDFLREHYERLKKACDCLQIPLEYGFSQIEKFAHELILASKIPEGGLKILWGENHHGGYLLLTVAENKYSQQRYLEGFKLCFTEIKRNPHSFLTYIKSNNYLENLMARRQAIKKEYDEVIFENINGNLCEGAISNLFFVKKDKVYTPHTKCGLLEGIMRNQIIKLVEEMNIPLEIGEYERKDLLEANEIFITNSLMEVMPVVRLEDYRLDIYHNPITRKIIEALKGLHN